jgi:hypothetical protein
MGKVLAFPGTAPARQAAASLADLPAGAKALLITRDRGRFLVTMTPATNSAEKACRLRFHDALRARSYCTGLMLNYPLLYRMVLDETRQEPLPAEPLGDHR